MNTVSIILLGLCALIVQSAVIIVASKFLNFHRERPLSAIGKPVMVTWVISTLLSTLSAILAPSTSHGLFSLVFFAFLALFIYLDAASRCLPRCFTLAFGLTGAIFRFLLSSESGLTATLTAFIVFSVLWLIRTFAYWYAGCAQFGLGDVYLMAGLGMWFSFPVVLWVIIGAVFLAGIYLLVRRLRYPKRWQQDVDFRLLPFAPFLCSVATLIYLRPPLALLDGFCR